MEKDDITYFALRDAQTETDENLEAAADLYDNLLQGHMQPAMVQNDLTATPLPNEMLQWFEFDFERVDLPDAPLLRRGEAPVWVGSLPGFTVNTGVADAQVQVRAEEFTPDEENEGSVAPHSYAVTIRAHGLDQDLEFTCKDWHQVQQRCRTLEHQLNESHAERHALCQTQDGDLSEEACTFCELGQKGR